MKCIIIDDDLMTQTLLANFADRSDLIKCVGTFNNPVEAQDVLKNKNVDLIFLDIEMPEMNGFDFLESVGSNQQIIIISANQKHALGTYEYSKVTDYLLKPISLERFKKSLNKFIDKYIELNSCCVNNNIYVKHNDKYLKVCITDVHYIEIMDNNTVFQTKDMEYNVTNRKMLEFLLSKEEFVRVNNSVLMNLDFVAEIDDSNAKIFSNGKYKSIPIEGEFLANLVQKFMNKNN